MNNKEKFVSFNKLSKREQKKINASKRKTWNINPVTRTQSKPNAYNRAKAKKCKF